jgi:hypothetical protein
MEIQQLESRRLAILEEIRSIESMRRGTINEQYFHVQRKGTKEVIRQGPYYVWTRSEGGKTISQRLTTAESVEQARQDVAAYKRFQALCGQYIEVTSKMGALKRRTEQEKKRSKFEWNKTGK